MALLTSLSACALSTGPADQERSIGSSSSGRLEGGRALPDRGRTWVRGRPGEETQYGTSTLIGVLTRAFDEVARAFPGGTPARVGDLSLPQGGRHPRHHSHRSGRDADVLFYLSDVIGRPIPSGGFLAFSHFGVARPAATGGAVFDDARNWHFVRTLLLDSVSPVQWIFVSRGLKTRLLDYARAYEPDPDALLRASYVLTQPENAAPHDDHFHVRVFCTAQERARGCIDTGPRWPWVRPDAEEIEGRPGPGLDDETLVDFLLAGGDPLEP